MIFQNQSNQLEFQISDTSDIIKQALKDREPIMVIVGGVCFKYHVTNYDWAQHYDDTIGNHTKLTVRGEETKYV